MNVNEAESLIGRTMQEISRNGFSIWQCGLFAGKITVIQDKDRDIFNRQLGFTDPLRVAAQYPVFTLDELNYLADKSEWTHRMVREAKSLAPGWIELEGEN